MIEVARTVIAVALALVALLVIAANWAMVIQGMRRKFMGSLIPLVGGIAGVLAVLIVPAPRVLGYFWVPLVADAGCLVVLAAIFEALRARIAKRARARPGADE